MSMPDREDQPSFERFALGWRIPPQILEPLLHPAAPAAATAAEDQANESGNSAEDSAAAE
jgi:hypothetical protein